MSINWASIYSKLLIVTFICSLCLWFVANFFQTSLMLLFVLVYIVSITTFGFLSLASSTHFSIQAKFWNFGSFLIALSLISWGVAEFVWFYYENFLFVEMPYPSLADVMYMGFYPLIICGLFPFIMDVREKIFSRSKLLVVLMLLLVAVISGIYFVLVHFSPGLPEETLKTIFDVSYVIWDTILLLVLVVLMGYVLVSSQSYKKYIGPMVVIFVGSLLMLLADVLFSYLSEIGTYTQGNYIDLIYLISAFLIGFATVEFSKNSAQNTTPVVK